MSEARGWLRGRRGSRLLSWLLTLGLLLAGIAGSAGLAPGVRAAMSVPVGCGTDGVGNPGDLIAAIAQVQLDPDGGTVVLAAECVYTVTEGQFPGSNGDNGLPLIAKAVRIEGNGATIERSDAEDTPAFRFFEVADGGSLTLDGVTLANGAVGAGQDGGAIYSPRGRVSVSNSTLSGNTAGGNGGAVGGGDGSVSVSSSMLSGNTATWGGAIRTDNGPVSVSNSTLSGNKALLWDGGAIRTGSGLVTVGRSTLIGNTAGGKGGAIYSETGFVTLTRSTLSDNTAGGDGGGIYAADQVMLTASTLSDNTALHGDGGAAYTYVGDVTLTRSTLSGNTAENGGGIYTEHGDVILTGSTLSGNTAGVNGGAIYTGSGAVTLAGSILASDIGDLCAVGDGGVDDRGYNLVTDASCALTAAGSENDVALDALALGELADTGGPTETIALGAGSVAIDRIPADACVDHKGERLTADQRDVRRPQGPGCDVGAFEVEYRAALTLDPGTGTPVVVDRTTRRATLRLGSTATVSVGDAQTVLPVSYTLTPLGGGTPLTCTDEHSSGGDATTLQSACSLPGVPAGRYTLTASVGGYYTGAAEPIPVVVDPLAGFVTGGGMVQGGMLSFSGSYYGTQLNGAISYQRTSGGRVSLSTTKLTSFVRVGSTVYLEGEAMLNGVSGHRVLVTAIDHPGLQRDQVQLQVWDHDGNLVASAGFDLTALQTGQVYLGPGL